MERMEPTYNFFHVAENGERKELTMRRGHATTARFSIAFKVIFF